LKKFGFNQNMWRLETAVNATGSLMIVTRAWPSIPPRTHKIKQWLGRQSNDGMPDSLPYPSRKNHAYLMRTGFDMVSDAIYWMDIRVAIKLIKSGQFDLNKFSHEYEKFT